MVARILLQSVHHLIAVKAIISGVSSAPTLLMTIMAKWIISQGVIGAVAFITDLFMDGALELLVIEKAVGPTTRGVGT